jgi:predicted hydrocarbon binding protein
MEEARWERSGLVLSRHFQAAVETLRQEVLVRPDYDPARLFRWGQMMSLAVIRMMEAAEARFGASGQEAMAGALTDLGREIGREVLRQWAIRPGTPEIRAISAFVTYVNEEIWASPERPQVLDESTCVCDILWCPHQEHYRPFDCRVQRHLVQGLLEAFEEKTGIAADAHFTQIIPKGAETCRFEIRWIPAGKPRGWTRYSEELGRKALERVGRAPASPARSQEAAKERD